MQRPSLTPRLPRLAPALLAVSVLLAAALPAAARGDGGRSFSVLSPYRTLAKSHQVLDAAVTRIALDHDYAEEDGAARGRKTAALPGVQQARFLARPVAAGRVRVLEVALAEYPAGGYQVHVWGFEGDGEDRRPNPDLAAAEGSLRGLLEELVAARDAAGKPTLGDRDNRFASYQLSYVQSDRAAALLKVLGYSVIEFEPDDKGGILVYDRIFSAPETGELELPVVIRLIDSEKTSLLQPPMQVVQESADASERGADSALNLGGLFLDRITTGVPQQRLLVAYDSADPAPMQALFNLLRSEIDIPARQLLIEALVIELDRDKLKDVGVDFDGSKDGSSVSFLTDQSGFAEPFTYTFKRPSLDTLLELNVTLKALVTDGHAKVLSRPSVLVLDGRQARIQVGEKIPYTSNISATNTGTLSSTDYLTTGIVLNLRPRIAEDGAQITMQVETLISSAGQGGFIAETGVLVAPPILSREVQTLVRVANNTPFIIGGLIAETEQHSVSGIPGLSKIPGLGALFRKKSKSESTKEVIVVVTPHVIPLNDSTFDYLIPKDSEIFDSFGKEVFRNVYRVKASDLFDVRFVYDSQVLKDLVTRIEERSAVDPSLRHTEPFRSLLAGAVPGEEILVRRLLYQLVMKKGFHEHIDPEKIFFFRESGDERGLDFTLVQSQLADAGSNALVLTLEPPGATDMERPFSPPRAAVSFEPMPELTEARYLERLRAGNPREGSGYERGAVVLVDGIEDMTLPLDRLRGVLVLKHLLEFNSQLSLTLRDFHIGLEVVFPSIVDLSERFRLVDREVVRMFYETADYYLAFEEEFTYRTRQILDQLGGAAALAPAAGSTAPAG